MTGRISKYLLDVYDSYRKTELPVKTVSPKEYGQYLAKKRRGKGKRGSNPKRR